MSWSDVYLPYDQLTAELFRLASQFPTLAQLDSVGQSREGREIWVATVTNQATGPAAEKPAVFIDGNLHASEVAGSAVCLDTIRRLLNQYGTDAEVTDLLDTRTFYIFPRTNPDGAEAYLAGPEPSWGATLGAVRRPWPPNVPTDGVVPADVDGNNMILQMRIRDPQGLWKVSAHDPRLLIKRAPEDREGVFYTLLPEGRLVGSGAEPTMAPNPYTLNPNRNFPHDWVPDSTQPNSGPYPLSEPETRAVAEFVLAHPNIVCMNNIHTHSGMIVRPLSNQPDSALPPTDLMAMDEIGKAGERVTGYPVVSTFHGFTSSVQNHGQHRHGTMGDWVYSQLGIIPYTTELWDFEGRAGVRRSLFGELTEAESLKILAWNDAELDGQGFVDWAPFDHPDFGPVEIGGWRKEWMGRNVPPPFLEAECAGNFLWNLRLAAASPLTAVTSLTADSLGADLYRVTLRIANTGYLPTNVTEQGKTTRTAPTVTAEIGLADGATLEMGARKQDLGHIPGRAGVPAGFFLQPVPKRQRQAQWLVRCPDPSQPLELRAGSARAGFVRIVKAVAEMEPSR